MFHKDSPYSHRLLINPQSFNQVSSNTSHTFYISYSHIISVNSGWFTLSIYSCQSACGFDKMRCCVLLSFLICASKNSSILFPIPACYCLYYGFKDELINVLEENDNQNIKLRVPLLSRWFSSVDSINTYVCTYLNRVQVYDSVMSKKFQ